MRDTSTIYKRCMESDQPHEVIARDVSLALESPFALHCEYHIDTSKNSNPRCAHGATGSGGGSG